MSESNNAIRKQYELIAEVFILIHYFGQIRFRTYVKNDGFIYEKSDKTYDNKIIAMSQKEMARTITTYELENYKKILHGLDMQQLVISKFEEVFNQIENPLKYIDQMYYKNTMVNGFITDIYIFPIGPVKRVRKEIK